MKEFLTYRLSGTGVWVYEFYDASRNRIGSVGAEIAPAAPVRINGENISWYSRFNLDNTIVPGTGRQVKDSRTGSEVYKVIYWRPGLYQIRYTNDASLQVEIREGRYLYGNPQEPVTAMTLRIESTEWTPTYALDVRPWFRTTVYKDLTPEELMTLLSFPALRFY